MIHELKTWPDFYKAIEDGRKTFEFRINDRGFQAGDVLHLREWDPKDNYLSSHNYTGKTMLVDVTYVLPIEVKGHAYLYVIMAIRLKEKE